MSRISNLLNYFGFFSKKKEKLQITVETKEYWEINLLRQKRLHFCPQCNSQTIFVPKDLSVQIGNDRIEKIEDLIKNGSIHFSDLPEKLICLTSLKKELENKSLKKFVINA